MHVIFKDRGLIDRRKVPGTSLAMRAEEREDGAFETYPLVKTFSNDVFPHAPSPLFFVSVTCAVGL